MYIFIDFGPAELFLFIIDIKAASQLPCCHQYYKKMQTAVIGSIFQKLFLWSHIAASKQAEAPPYGSGWQEVDFTRKIQGSEKMSSFFSPQNLSSYPPPLSLGSKRHCLFPLC